MFEISKWLEKMPSTNVRIAVTLVCVVFTAAAYTIAWRAPDGGWEAWLTFLATMAGIDAVQFFAKRKTHTEKPAPAPVIQSELTEEPTSTASTDVSELSVKG